MAESRPPERLGDLRLIRPLGEGGMGSVWLAYDEALGRRVAIKWVRHASPALVERLQQEAHLHARVEHPAVCRLYQVGEHEGAPYLVLEFVDGMTLAEASPRLEAAELLRLFIALADGVHSAHRQGLIHRDLKPGNLMVAKDEEGGLRPYVMDFGLARDTSEDGLTEAGVVLGTPAYMAPEQLTGAWLDPRADVYGLGASLFAALTGRPPFLGDREQVLAQVGLKEAPPLRSLRKDLSLDLETLVATCLAPDPARRYPGAAALRDDLQRLLDGQPIRARRASWLERGLRWTGRNRLSAGLAAGVIVLGLGLGATWFVLHQRAQIQSEWAQRFDQEALRMDSILRFGRMLPPHDTARERLQIQGRMDLLRHQMRGSRLSRGPGHWALGEGHLLLGEVEAARRELDEAWARGFRTAEVSLALGRCLALQYQNAIATTQGELDTQVREAKQAEARRSFLQPALTHMGQAKRGLGALTLEDQARLAMAEDRFDEATRLARLAREAEPWRTDALYLLARAHVLRGRERLDTGRIPAGLADLQQALDLIAEAAPASPSDDRFQDLTRFVWLLGAPHRFQDQDPLECHTRSVIAAERMLVLNTLRTDKLYNVALALGQLGKRHAALGRDPEPWFQRAEDLMQGVLRAPAGRYAASERGKAFERLANLAYMRAVQAVKAKRDPEPQILPGLALCRQALAEGLGQWETHQNQAFLEMVRADWQKDHRGNPIPALRRAIASLQDCARLNPSADSYANLAELSNQLADAQAKRGLDPMATLASSRQALAQALSVHPDNANALALEGDRALAEARWCQGHGGDPLPALASGREALARAAAAAPDEAWIHASRCLLHAFAVEVAQARKADGSGDRTQALESGRRALALKLPDTAAVRAALAKLGR